MKRGIRLSGLSLFLIVLLLFCLCGGVAFAEEQEVYLGGIPIGIGLADSGLIVTGIVDVITDEGVYCPARGTEISTGDMITEINGQKVLSLGGFVSSVQKSKKEVVLTLKRGERVFSVTLTPVTDTLTGLKKLGLTLKNGINGIGTLTFVKENDSFGALGHGIVDVDTGKTVICDVGSIYSCRINSFKKAEQGKAGELSGTFLDRDSPIGEIRRCNEFGVYGIADRAIIRGLKKVAIADRREVKPGDAYIYSTIHGEMPSLYKIEIIKTASQKTPKEKSMLIRVVDETLLAETGGILQGMSGSPILQNGKLVGAVTHVLVNDSTLGYGIYLDWMLENAS